MSVASVNNVVELDEHRFDLRSAMRALLADTSLDHLSDYEIVNRFIADLSSAEKDAVLHTTLVRYFADVRRKGFRDAADGVETQSQPTRWDRIDHTAVAKLRSRVFSEWVMTEQGRKRFGDCTADDVQWLADERCRQSARNLAWARKFDKVCKAMQRANVATVAELGDEAVRLIANA